MMAGSISWDGITTSLVEMILHDAHHRLRYLWGGAGEEGTTDEEPTTS